MILPENTLGITHMYTEKAMLGGGNAVDCTMGNGHDTLFLAELAGENGHVTAFDIQSTAVENTKRLIESHGLSDRVSLIHAGHEHIDEYVTEPICAAMFNLGYLPGGNHSIATRADTTICAINKCLELLQPGGIVSIGIYYGGDSGFDEKNAVYEFLKTVDFKKYLLISHEYINRPNCPPIAVIIEKL